MKIYYERAEVADFPKAKDNKRGAFWTRLVGIHLAGRERLEITPVYQPLIHIEKSGSVILIELSTHQPILDIWLSPRKPFVQIYKPTGFTLED